MTVPIEGAPPIDGRIDAVHATVAAISLTVGVLMSSVAALILGCAASVMLIAARSDYREYAFTDIGRYERIQNRGVFDTTETCAVCESIADGGQEARRFTELVAFGIVLKRYNNRSRYYCDEHGSVTVTNDLTEQQAQSTAPIVDTECEADE